MSEPASTTVAGVVGYKALIASGLGAGLAAIVVMCMMTPRSPKEWAVGLISTVVGSVAGGAAAIEYFQLHALMGTTIGLVSVIGLVFACGLPAWAIVRWIFTYIDKRKDHDIGQIYDDVKTRWWGAK